MVMRGGGGRNSGVLTIEKEGIQQYLLGERGGKGEIQNCLI